MNLRLTMTFLRLNLFYRILSRPDWREAWSGNGQADPEGVERYSWRLRSIGGDLARGSLPELSNFQTSARRLKDRLRSDLELLEIKKFPVSVKFDIEIIILHEFELKALAWRSSDKQILMR